MNGRKRKTGETIEEWLCLQKQRDKAEGELKMDRDWEVQVETVLEDE